MPTEEVKTPYNNANFEYTRGLGKLCMFMFIPYLSSLLFIT